MRAFDSSDRGDPGRDGPMRRKLLERLAPDDAEHFEQVRCCSMVAGIRYELIPTLVRGLDYYTRTLFEFPATPSAPSPGRRRRWSLRPLLEHLSAAQSTPVSGFAAGPSGSSGGASNPIRRTRSTSWVVVGIVRTGPPEWPASSSRERRAGGSLAAQSSSRGGAQGRAKHPAANSGLLLRCNLTISRAGPSNRDWIAAASTSWKRGGIPTILRGKPAL